MRPIRLIIADDHVLVRKSIISLLKNFPFINLVGDVNNGRELVDLLKEKEADVILLDLEMPIMNGAEALEIITKRFPDVRVIMVTMYCESLISYDMMMKGARACLAKNCDVDSLIETIRAVHETGYCFSEKVSQALLKGSMREKSINPLLSEQSITDREREVLQLLCAGYTNKEAAARLNITPRTIDFHRSNLYVKTKSSNIAELVRYALQNGLVDLNQDYERRNK